MSTRGRNVLRGPYSGAVAWDAPWASREEALATLEASRAAHRCFAAMPLDERVARVRRGVDAFEEQTDAIARHVCELVGKPLARGARWRWGQHARAQQPGGAPVSSGVGCRVLSQSDTISIRNFFGTGGRCEDAHAVRHGARGRHLMR